MVVGPEAAYRSGTLVAGRSDEIGMQNLHLIRGQRYTVPRGTPRVFIPRKNHYANKIYNSIQHAARMDKFGGELELCVVKRNILTGFGWHRCPYHMLYIQEEEKTTPLMVSK